MGARATFGGWVAGLGLAGYAALASCDAATGTLMDAGSPTAPAPTTVDATTSLPDATTTDATTADTSVGPGLAKPPPDVGPATTTRARHTLALRVLFLGDTDRTSVTSSEAWRSLGYDLDGLASSASSVEHCAIGEGATTRVRADGAQGIDNAFGAHVLPLLATFDPALSRTTNEVLAAGRGNTLLEITGLDLDPLQTASGLSARAFDATARTSRPAWNGGDELSVLPSSLVDGATLLSGAKSTFRASYVNAGVVVATGGDMHVRFPLGGATLALDIHNTTISFRKPKSGFDTAEGTIAGTLDVDELLAHLRDEAGRVTPVLCDGTRYDELAAAVRAAADIGRDGTNRAGTACDAISIGLGFVATELRPITTVASDPAPPRDPCQ